MNSWTDNFYHDQKGRILGSLSFYDNRYKASLDNKFLGWFISEEHAKQAVQDAYNDSLVSIGTSGLTSWGN